MKLAYVDTSCLVAVALGERGAGTVAKRLSGFQRLFSSNLLEAELRSALAREEVVDDCGPILSWIGWVYPDRPLSPEFRRALEGRRIRGADLWHLACALYLKERLPDLAFLTLDRAQEEAARELGFETKP